MSDSDEDLTPVDVDFRQSAAAFRAENARVSKVEETPEQRAQREEEERVAAEVWADINKLRQGRATATRAPRARQPRAGAAPAAAGAAPTERQLEARRKRDEDAAKFRAQREAMARQSAAATSVDEFQIQIGTTVSPQKAPAVSHVIRQPEPEREPQPAPAAPVQTPSPVDEPNDLDFLDDVEEDPVVVAVAAKPAVRAVFEEPAKPAASTPEAAPAAAAAIPAATTTTMSDGIDWKARYEAERESAQKLSDLLKEYDATMTQMVSGNDAGLLADVERLKSEVAELEARAKARDGEHKQSLKEAEERAEAERAAAAKEFASRLREAEGQVKTGEEIKAKLEAELEAARTQIAELKQAATETQQQHEQELQALGERHQGELDSLAAKHSAELDAKTAAAPVAETSSTTDQNRHLVHEHRLLQLKCARLTTVNTALEASKGALEDANKELMLICDELLLAAADSNRG